MPTATNPAIVKRALKVSAIVGTVLCAINHGDAMLAGEMTSKRWIQCALTYLVPYLVSTYSSLAALRDVETRKTETG